MSVPREGGCSCGAVRYRLTSDPLFDHCCHCLNCQRQTGSAFVINLLIEAERVELLAGEPQPVDGLATTAANSGSSAVPTCQVAVFSQYGRPEIRFVRGGTLDRPVGRRARRPHLHQVETALDHAPGLGAGVRGLLRHESPVAGRQPRTARGDHHAGEPRREAGARAAIAASTRGSDGVLIVLADLTTLVEVP